MSDILLGSETYELTVTCALCGRTEIMYVPTETSAEAVSAFLIGRGWVRSPEPVVWLCPSGHKP